MLSTLLWFGIEFSIQIILVLFLSVSAGVGLAGGFNLYDKFFGKKPLKAKDEP